MHLQVFTVQQPQDAHDFTPGRKTLFPLSRAIFSRPGPLIIPQSGV